MFLMSNKPRDETKRMQLMLLKYTVCSICSTMFFVVFLHVNIKYNAAISNMSMKPFMIKYLVINRWLHNLDPLLLYICGSAFLQC